MVIYQIYPRSFHDSNNDGLGDLKGITEKLPYLADLGVDTLWISPFFKSPMKDFGYDVSDYCAIDPLFGTMSDFEAMMTACQKYGLNVMIDLVLSHSSDQHTWFQESRQSRTNSKANWYVWADPQPNGAPPNNWMSLFGGNAWEWDDTRKQFYLHNFLKEQPDFNFHEPEVRKALLAACEFWFKKGVKGLRLDVCNFYFHSAGLENNPIKKPNTKNTEGVHAGNPYNFQEHIYDKDRPENIGFLKDLRALADRYPGTTLMGEVVSDDSLGVMKQYISGGYPLHTAYNFSLFKPVFEAVEMGKTISDFQQQLPTGSPTWALGNHDVPRFVSRFKGEKLAPLSTKFFLTFLFCLKGNVIIYQGDELGLDEAEIPFELMQDPFGIAFYPEFKGRDGCRTPMPWNEHRPENKTWLPIPESHLKKSVEAQQNDPHSVLNFTKKLINWRQKNSWLNSANLEVFMPTADKMIINRTSGTYSMQATFDAQNFTYHVTLNDKAVTF